MIASRPLLLGLLLIGLLGGCAAPVDDGRPFKARTFELDDLAKSDVDLVAEINIAQSLGYLRELARKLYVRNPNQLRRSGRASVGEAVDALFTGYAASAPPGLHGARSASAIHLAFDPLFDGDRVAAFVTGLRTMLLDGYGGRREFYLHHMLDPQKLHYLARNFEIAFWKLKHDRDAAGRPVLLSNSLLGAGDLSFERLAGKLIGLQDHMAQVVSESTNRQIKNVIQGAASAVFFPI